MGLKSSGSGGGEIVQVQGGHLVRATGRKDRHSKVYTAKGPRDRRVRLSAHTAIQFYDVQDRLGYDRPSKAVDWLIKKAKSAIDKLNESQELPSHEDHAGKAESSEPNFHMVDAKDDENQQVAQFSSSLVAPMATLDPEDAMKTFFPTSSSNSNINFQTYPHDIISRTANLNQELGLSLHPSFHGNTGQASSATDQTLFSTFDANNFQRMTGWNSELTPEQRGFLVNSSHQASVATLLNHQQTLFLGQGPPLLSHQRGTLQSSFSQPFRSWDHHHTDNHHHQQQQQPSMFASHFGSHGIMQGLSVPTRLAEGEGEGLGLHRPSPSSSSPRSHR